MSQNKVQDKGARFLLVAASLVIITAGMKAASDLILPFMIALFLALISFPLLNWLQRKKIAAPLAVLATIMAVLLVLSGIGVLIGGSIRAFRAQAPKYKQRLEVMYTGSLNWLEAQGVDISERAVTDLINPAQALDLVTGTLTGVASVLSNLFLVLLTMVFILSEAAGFTAKLQAALGQEGGSDRFANIKDQIQRYLGIKTLISLATGGVVTAALAALGVDFPLLWGAVAFLLNYIPNLGSILAAIPPVLLAAIQFGLGRALAVASVFAIVNTVLGNFVEPHFMGRRLGLSTLVVFLSLLFWGWVWGPVGMLLSVPLTMVVKIMLENTADLRWIAVLLDASPPKVAQPEIPPQATHPSSAPD